MIQERIAPRVWKVSEGKVAMFVGVCPEGCRWMLSPDYRTFGWTVQHGDNPESALVFKRVELDPFDPAAMFEAIDEWLGRCHEYEVTTSHQDRPFTDQEVFR